jgi:molybdate transport system substrate-binding protein
MVMSDGKPGSSWKALVAALMLLLVTASASAQDTVTVFAAASLANAFGEVSKQFEKEKGIRISHSFASSATLAKQIEAGAPADIFISANAQWMDYLQQRGHIATTSRRNLLGNRLVVIVPKGGDFPLRFERSFDFAATLEGRLCMGNVASVPAGIYGKQALTYLGWWDAVKGRIVSTSDVRAALAFVERGECVAGIVYASDALVSDKVQIAGEFPEQSHEPIVYPMALVGEARNMHKDYWEFLQSPASAAVFARHGFRQVN